MEGGREGRRERAKGGSPSPLILEDSMLRALHSVGLF